MSTKNPQSPKLVIVAASRQRHQLSDSQQGPLAEARALADVMNILAVDDLMTSDNTLPVLTRMLCDQLARVQETLEAEVANG